ncbi:MAG: sigma-70 family RNA polymerase sigma factor [Deltaproteobacteria bacterium]|nr:sigma-70 family RNA polymerase sigma factor [Deltaproteobacteria bacterium]
MAHILVTPAPPPALSDDWALIQRCVRGDVDAFRPLVERYQRLAYSVALRMLSVPADAEDVVQQAFTQAFGALPRFDGSGHDAAFRVWLLRIVVNGAKDLLKSKHRGDVALTDDETAWAALAPGASPEEIAGAHGEGARLARGLATLPEKYRTSLILKDVEDLSYEEMRGILRLPITTLKIRVVRARAMLRAWLESEANR